MRVTPVWLRIMAAIGLVSCASSSFDGRVYRNDALAFRIGPQPSAWREIQVEGALLAFRDDVDRATIAVNGRCGVDGDDVPLPALTHHLFLHFTERRVLHQKTLTLDGREALRTDLSAKLDGVPRHFLVYVLKKDGCVYDFMWIGSPASQASARADFESFVLGFSTRI